MQMEDTWRKVYRENRYLENVDQDGLEARARDLAMNIRVMREEAGVGKVPLTGEGMYWMSLWVHVEEELELRDGKHPKVMCEIFHKDAKGSFEGDEKALAISKAVCERLPLPQPSVVVYGIEKDLRRAVQTGEMVIPLGSLPVSSEFSDVEGCERQYVLSLHSTLKTRLFLDKGADACLVITRPRAFMDHVAEKCRACAPGLEMRSGPVMYVDPLQRMEHAGVLFTEHFRLAYQREYRMVWPVLNPELKGLSLKVEGLGDMCEAVYPFE